MGRVDEAIRRAGGGVEVAPRAETPAAAPSSQEIDVLAQEPFPHEVQERRQPHPMDPATSEETPSESIPAASPAPAPPAPEWSLFQRMDARVAGKIVVDHDMLPASREQYRRLAAVLHHAQVARNVKVVMIASAVAAEGKSLTAANLSLTLSESYHRSVLLIDADLRRPTLHTVFKINGSPGLSEGLYMKGRHKLPVHPVSKNLTVLPAGQPSADPMAGLTSPQMRQLLEEAKTEFDWVIIDTPPVGLLTDANLLASMVDGAILVVRAGRTPYDMVQRAVAAIGTNRLLGVVLNGAAARLRAYGYDYYSSYHTPAPPPDAPQ